jgi:predicted P-loop ATPase
MKNNSEKVYDDRGGSVRDEAKQYPIEKLKLLSTSGINGAKIYNRCTENVFRILRNHPDFKNTFRYNDWTKKKEIYKNKRWVEVSDEDYTPIQRKISSMYSPFRMLSKDMVIDAVADVCQSNIIDPAKLYIKKIIWDGVGRIDTWMQKAYGTPDDIYHRAVGSNFFKGIVNRIMRPGCKFDTCIILKGQQGCGKSTSFTMIAGNDWFLETTERADDKDFLLQFRGKLIVDFCEGETMSRTDFKALKAIISTSADTYRTPY